MPFQLYASVGQPPVALRGTSFDPSPPQRKPPQSPQKAPQFGVKQRLNKGDAAPDEVLAVEDGVALNLQNSALQKAPFTRLCIHSNKKGYKFNHTVPTELPEVAKNSHKRRASAHAMGSFAGAAHHATYRTLKFTIKGTKIGSGSDEEDLDDFGEIQPSGSNNSPNRRNSALGKLQEERLQQERRKSAPGKLPSLEPPSPSKQLNAVPQNSLMPDAYAGPPKEFIKSIHGHYCVAAPKSKWLGLLTFLFDETLLHPHALVYCDKSVVSKKGFESKMQRHNLRVADYEPDDPGARHDFVGNVERHDTVNQFLVTNPKFSSMMSEPSISCIFHMDRIESPLTYGAQLMPVDEELGWDAISVLFVEPKDQKNATEIESTFGIRFQEIPFDLPEISMHWGKRHGDKR